MLKHALILSALMWALTTVSEVCKPWGIRLYFGDSYMFADATNDLRIVFNTDVDLLLPRTPVPSPFSSCRASTSTA